jgi:DNA-binding NarL/FixJ family response regulator
MRQTKNFASWKNTTGFIERLDAIEDPRQSLDQPEPNKWRGDRLNVVKNLLEKDGLKDVVSERQAEILRFLLLGFGVSAIARILKLSHGTVSAHIREARGKLRKFVEAGL